MAAVMRIVYAEDARLSRQRIAAIDAQKAKKLAEITAEANLAKRTAELQARAKHLEEIRENARKFEELQAKTAAELQAKRAAKNAADVAQFWADHDEAQPKPVLKTAEPQLAPVPELFDEQEKAEQFETLWAEK
jgi:hypothetical protein